MGGIFITFVFFFFTLYLVLINVPCKAFCNFHCDMVLHVTFRVVFVVLVTVLCEIFAVFIQFLQFLCDFFT